MIHVFIDGREGTTGLRIFDRLSGNPKIHLLTLSETERKDPQKRSEMLNSCDVVFLCLPDDAARQAVEMTTNEHVRIIDASTAHRTEPGWAYGLPELDASFREKIASAKRIAVPGCHASGFIALVYPLIREGFLSPDTALCCTSLTGYSGAGKKTIAVYENGERDPLLDAPRLYALGQQHKHLKEMKAISGISLPPAFLPVIGDFYSGMLVSVPIFAGDLKKGGLEDLKALYRERYAGKIVRYRELDEGGFASANALSGKDSMEIYVQGCEDRILLMARYDNLGKGASGAALQNMNIACGFEETEGLAL